MLYRFSYCRVQWTKMPAKCVAVKRQIVYTEIAQIV